MGKAVLGLMANLRMRKVVEEIYAPDIPWHAYLIMLAIAAAWPILVVGAIVEPLLRKRLR